MLAALFIITMKGALVNSNSEKAIECLYSTTNPVQIVGSNHYRVPTRGPIHSITVSYMSSSSFSHPFVCTALYILYTAYTFLHCTTILLSTKMSKRLLNCKEGTLFSRCTGTVQSPK